VPLGLNFGLGPERSEKSCPPTLMKRRTCGDNKIQLRDQLCLHPRVSPDGNSVISQRNGFLNRTLGRNRLNVCGGGVGQIGIYGTVPAESETVGSKNRPRLCCNCNTGVEIILTRISGQVGVLLTGVEFVLGKIAGN